jgi:hypothetical protein
MKTAVILGSVLLLCSTGLHAQTVQAGKYSGTLKAFNNRRLGPATFELPIVIDINGVDNGKLKGTIHSPKNGDCGSKPQAAEGTYDGSNLKIRSVEALVRGCDELTFKGVAEGSRLVGTMPLNGAPWDITLSK